MIESTSRCPTCGAPLDARRSGGVCMACVLLDAVGETSADSLGWFGGHELIEEIARGGMGVVYRARQAQPAREVALKTLHGTSLRSAEARERFRIEAQAMARLDHPHILPIYGQGDENETPFLTMKFASGGSLAQRIGDYPGRWREIAALVASVADAVQFAHEHGVLHRDLKPANILFDDDGTPFVCDFGLAKLAGEESDLTRTVAMLGTPNYMAPESTTRAGSVTTASDVWSLGVILYELLTGVPPFRGETLAAVLRQIAEDEPPPLNRTGIPRDLAVIACKALQKDPARRFASARELADDLCRWLAGEPIQARPVAPTERVLLWAKRKPALAAMSLILALVLLIGSALVLRANRDLRAAVVLAQTQKDRAESGLRDSLIAQSGLVRQSLQIGQRFKALELIRHAVAASAPSIELRHEAAAALAEPDVALAGEVARFEHITRSARSAAVTPDFRFILAVGPDDPAARLRELDTGKTIWQPATRRASPPGELHLSASGRFAALIFGDQWVEVWDTTDNRLLLGTQILPKAMQATDTVARNLFHLHERLPLIAGVDGAGTVWMHDLATGQRTELLTGKSHATAVLIDDPGTGLAIATGTAVELWEVAGRRKKWSRSVGNAGGLLDWSGTALVASDQRAREALVVRGGGQPTRVNHPRDGVVAGRFLPWSTQLLLLDSLGWLTAWDARDGRALWEMPAGDGCLVVHELGTAFLIEDQPGHLVKWQRAPDRVFAEFHHPGDAGGAAALSAIQISRDGRLVATHANTGALLWDTRTRRFLHQQRLGDSERLGVASAFAPDGSAWFVTRRGGPGIYRLSLEWVGDDTLRLGEPTLVPGSEGKWLEAISDDGNTWVVRTNEPRSALWRPDGTPPAGLADDVVTRYHELSPRRRYLFIPHSPRARNLTILDAITGQTVGEYSAQTHRAVFSPGEHWLVVQESSAYRFLETGTWQQRAAVPCRIGAGQIGVAAVSADGTLAAVEQGREVIDLLSLPSGRLLVRLTPPHPLTATGMTFSPDGTRLYLIGVRHRLYEWNLAALHEELAKLGLVW